MLDGANSFLSVIKIFSSLGFSKQDQISVNYCYKFYNKNEYKRKCKEKI